MSISGFAINIIIFIGKYILAITCHTVPPTSVELAPAYGMCKLNDVDQVLNQGLARTEMWLKLHTDNINRVWLYNMSS